MSPHFLVERGERVGEAQPWIPRLEVREHFREQSSHVLHLRRFPGQAGQALLELAGASRSRLDRRGGAGDSPSLFSSSWNGLK